MNDITKARYFLKTKGSKLKDLESFGLMLATAESKYRDIRLQRQGLVGDPNELDSIEVDALLDYAILKYLKRHNRLPKSAREALAEGTSLGRQRELAVEWSNS